MNKITEDDIKKIALLSRLELNPGETAKFAGQLENILEYIATLSEVDVEGVEPFANPAAACGAMRADVARPSLSNDAATANAPSRANGFFKVPAVIQ